MSAADRPTRISYFVTSDQESDARTLGHSTFVIEWEDGKILLIDTGMDRANAIEFGELFETLLGADPATFYGTVPDLMGDDIARVEGIGFTHLHVDHVQGIEAICGEIDRPVTILQTSDQATEHNLHTSEQADMLEANSCAQQVRLAEGERASPDFPGIGIYPMGGHTPGSTMFAVPVGDTLWLLSGDIANTRENLVENHPKGFFYSYLMVPEYEARLEQIRLLLMEFDAEPNINVIVSHDAEAISASGMELWE
ncbi:MBL fold metallo-hydrolase [uncultured Erythrobacter sp.]|uniref:MBL fold metallo-hydrolase n=1 Tax=uncultured Erythrobacter sp. TaxID=263913 RepID=UPI0026263270|nr:MBL fold metallo-hydrolase [uncultured Erythrobacter sp.]